MYDIDLNRYTEVVDSAIALRPQIEKAVDEICAQGYSNLFFIGCGGTYAHSLPMMYWLESTTNKVEAHAVIAAEFMVMGHKAFSKDSVCIFSTRSGNTKEIVAAAKFCKEAGARTMVYVSNDNTPVCEYADYKFYSPAEDPDLCEAIYSYTICLLGRFMKNAGAFDKYDEFMAQYAGLTKYLIAGKEKFDPFCQELAKKFKNVDYHMVIGGGTTDVAIVSMNGIVTSHSVRAAGNTLDQAIIRYMQTKYKLLIGERTAERLKIEMTNLYDPRADVTSWVKGRNLVSGLPEMQEISELEIFEAVEDVIADIIEAIKTVLEETPPELVGDIYENGVLMAGGGAMLGGLRKLVERTLQVKCVVAKDAIHCVAKGTAIAFRKMDTLLDGFENIAVYQFK